MSALVRRLLLDVGTEETEFERRKRLQDETLAFDQAFRRSQPADARRGARP